MTQIRRSIGLFFLCIFILSGCEDTTKKAQLAKQEALASLTSQICPEGVYETSEEAARITCASMEVQIPWQQKTAPIEVHMAANAEFAYVKYGAQIPATYSATFRLRSHEENALQIELQLVAGEKQDQLFDLVYDYDSNQFYRQAEGTKTNGVTFLPSLHTALSQQLAEQIRKLGSFVIQHYGQFYQIQQLLLEQPAAELREDAYELVYDPALLLQLQYDFTKENGIYQTKPEEGLGNYDLANKRLYVHPCQDCEASKVIYDWKQDLVIFYPDTTKEAKVDPNTCSTQRYCETSKSVKDRFIASLAIQVKSQPFTAKAEYNQSFTRGNAIELSKYFAAIQKH